MRIKLLSLSFALLFAAVALADDKTIKVRGKIVKLDADNSFVIRTDDNKEVILYVSPQSRFTLDGKPSRLADVKINSEIETIYIEDGGRNVVRTVTLGKLPDEGTVLEGRIVRVIGEDQVVLMTPEKKEVIVYVVPQTTYTFDDRPVKFVDLRPGADVRVTYDLRDRRPVARTFIGRPVRRR